MVDQIWRGRDRVAAAELLFLPVCTINVMAAASWAGPILVADALSRSPPRWCPFPAEQSLCLACAPPSFCVQGLLNPTDLIGDHNLPIYFLEGAKSAHQGCWHRAVQALKRLRAAVAPHQAQQSRCRCRLRIVAHLPRRTGAAPGRAPCAPAAPAGCAARWKAPDPLGLHDDEAQSGTCQSSSIYP